MLKRTVVNLLGLVLLLGGAARAQSGPEVTVPSGAKFVVHVDVGAFKKTELGGKLFRTARAKAMEELANEGDAPGIEQIREMLGFDPFEEIQALTVIGSDYEHPEKDMRMVVQMRRTTGNLEGMIVGLPGYEAFDHGKHKVHSATPEKNMRAFGAFHTDGSGTKRIVAATNRDAVTTLLDALDGRSRAGGQSVNLGGGDGTFVHVKIMEFPGDKLGDGPQANIAQLLKGVAVQLGSSNGNFNIAVTLTAADEKQVQQLQQMVQGAVALVSFAQSQDGADEDLKRAQEILQGLSVDAEGTTLRLKLTIDADQVQQFLREEADLEL